MNTLNIEQAITDARVNRWDVVIEKAKAFAEENYDNGPRCPRSCSRPRR